MNPRIELAVRNAACDLCQMCSGATDICVVADGPADAEILVVSKQPWYPKLRKEMEAHLEHAGLDPANMAWTSAIKCKNWVADPNRTDIKTCSQYLGAEIEVVKPKWVLALGNEPLQALTGHSGITKHRAVIYPKDIRGVDVKVVATLSPSAVSRNPGQLAGFQADLSFFAAHVQERSTEQSVDYTVVSDKELLRRFVAALKRADTLIYDIETYGRSESAEDALMISLSATLDGPDGEQTWVLPLGHPQSPWRKQWRTVLKAINPAWNEPTKHVAHNGKYDARWMRYHGVNNARVTFDTMLAAHLLDENRLKGLKILGRSLLGVDPWGIDTRDLRGVPLSNVLHYNALDTHYTYGLYKILRDQLVAQPRLLRVNQFVMIPANEEYIRAEALGMWVDRERLATRHKIAQEELAAVDARLMEFVPDEIPVLSKARRPKPTMVNFNPSSFLRWLLFDHLELPVLQVGKTGPSMKEEVLLELQDKHPIVPILLERTKWQKYVSSFTGAYVELLDERDRLHTTFKLYGTTTGRTSSGKEEQDKVKVSKVRGFNAQQVPRDDFIRGLFGAPLGWTFVEADFSQVELRVVAFLSRDPTMMMLYQTGQDIHRATASSTLGIAPDKVTKEDRKKAKAINFGFVYGMGARKFIHTAFTKYQLDFTIDEAQGIRRAFFEQFSGLPRWHAKQRRLAHRYKRVVSPLGRVRHLPDIDSPDEGVQAEAERQAINSPVQSFASDLTLLSMSLIAQEFRRRGMRSRVIGTVHDAINFEVPDEEVATALPIIKDTMQNLPLRRLFGCEVDVPIIADLKAGTHWGDARELTEEEVYGWESMKLQPQSVAG